MVAEKSDKKARALLWAIQEAICLMIAPGFEVKPGKIETLMNRLRAAEVRLIGLYSDGDDVTASEIGFYSPPGDTPFETALILVFYLAATIQEAPYNPNDDNSEVWSIAHEMRMDLEDFWGAEVPCL